MVRQFQSKSKTTGIRLNLAFFTFSRLPVPRCTWFSDLQSWAATNVERRCIAFSMLSHYWRPAPIDCFEACVEKALFFLLPQIFIVSVLSSH